MRSLIWIYGRKLLSLQTIAVVALGFVAPADILAETSEAKGQVPGQTATDFSLRLHQALAAKNDENTFFSPFSIRSAFAMVHAGARSETATEMERALGYEGSGETVAAAIQKISRSIKHSAEAGGIDLQIANSLWPQEGYPLLGSYLQVCKKYFDAEPREVDYKQPSAAAAKINGWVAEQTRNRIQDLVPVSVLSAATRLILVNAIYFKANWLKPFEASGTYARPFSRSADTKITADFMHQTSEFKYFENEQFQALELPYEGNQLALTILLPKAGTNLQELQTIMLEGGLLSALQNMKTELVAVALPKFRIETSMMLGTVLQELGIKKAFLPDQADFSGMSTLRELLISEVLQKTFLDVGEKGTEAAAATAVLMKAGSAARPGLVPEPKVFRADHPFVFLIRDLPSSEILFFGRLTNPGR